MERSEKFSKKLGESRYFNKNCWLIKSLGYNPYRRCQYCELKFRNCLFLHYQIVSTVLLILILVSSFLIERKISEFLIIIVFTLVIVYGYFFNKSTDKLIQANFSEKKAKGALEELNKKLEDRVEQRTKELRQAYEELKVLDKAKSEFISMASHQLRTPLSVIKGYISMMLEGSYGKLSEEVKEKMGYVFYSNERLIKIVNTLLNISEIELGKTEIKKQPTQLEDLIQSCYEELKIEAEKKKLNLVFEKPKKPLPRINLDSSKIRQIILNLIDNAIRYTQEGKIEIGIKKTNSSVLIWVKDTGEGLSKNEQRDIFKGFTRGSAGINYFIEGAGLGLYVAKKFLELHNGKIWAESSDKSKGSTFYIELPLG